MALFLFRQQIILSNQKVMAIKGSILITYHMSYVKKSSVSYFYTRRARKIKYDSKRYYYMRRI